MRISAASLVDRDALVKIGQRHMLDAIMRPADEALPTGQARRIRERAERLVERGYAVAAEALVQDEVTLAALEEEIKRHVAECSACVALPGLACIEYGRLDSRANRLLALVANAGGLR